jgi:hypothetical protein
MVIFVTGSFSEVPEDGTPESLKAISIEPGPL